MQHKILVVDDEENIRTVLKQAFSGLYHVLTASEGRTAMELIKSESPVFVFLDIKMPGFSGLEVLKQIKESGLSPVIWMLTGEDDLEIALDSLKLGATGYLTKPFEISKVRDIVNNTISESERREQHDTSGDKPWEITGKEGH